MRMCSSSFSLNYIKLRIAPCPTIFRSFTVRDAISYGYIEKYILNMRCSDSWNEEIRSQNCLAAYLRSSRV